jgi:hypothetical protein
MVHRLFGKKGTDIVNQNVAAIAGTAKGKVVKANRLTSEGARSMLPAVVPQEEKSLREKAERISSAMASGKALIMSSGNGKWTTGIPIEIKGNEFTFINYCSHGKTEWKIDAINIHDEVDVLKNEQNVWITRQRIKNRSSDNIRFLEHFNDSLTTIVRKKFQLGSVSKCFIEIYKHDDSKLLRVRIPFIKCIKFGLNPEKTFILSPK